MKNWIKFLVAVAAVTFLACPEAVRACSACFGKSDSPMAQGMNAGIYALLVVIGGVLTGAASFFVFLARRASSFEKEQNKPSSETKAP